MIPRAILTILVALAVPVSASAATRYASPSGTGDCTTPATACPLATAVSGAVGGDEVVVAAGAGAYGAPGSELALNDDNGAVTVRGAVPGPGRPVVNGHFSIGVGSRIEDLEVVSAEDFPIAIYTGGVANRVLARSTNPTGSFNACSLNFGGELRNSLCLVTEPSTSTAAAFLQGGSGTPLARNVTAIGSGYGLTAKASTTVEAAILQGDAKQDFYGQGTSEADGLNNVFRDVLYQDVFAYAPGSTDRISAAPIFRAAGDYREAANSPTVDAGDLEDATTGATDLDLNGNLRKLGMHVDVGAYELPPAPAVVAGANTTSSADGATLAGTINPGGGRTTWSFEYGAGFAQTTPAVTIPATLASTPVSAAIPVGESGTPYRLVATSDGGITRSADLVAYRAPALAQGDPTNVTTTTATLNGTVALKGAPSGKVEFVYGAATSAPQTIAADGPVKADLTGLAPKTTYQWKLRVTRGAEIFETALGQFTTAATATTTNPTGTVTPAPSGEPGASPSPSPSASPEPTTAPAPTAPSFSVGTSTTKAGQRLLFSTKGLTVTFRCGDLACGAKASGTVSIARKRYGILAAPRTALQLQARERGTIRLSANKRLRKRVRRYLEQHPKAKAVIRLKAVFAESTGTKVTKRVTLRVRRLKR